MTFSNVKIDLCGWMSSSGRTVASLDAEESRCPSLPFWCPCSRVSSLSPLVLMAAFLVRLYSTMLAPSLPGRRASSSPTMLIRTNLHNGRASASLEKAASWKLTKSGNQRARPNSSRHVRNCTKIALRYTHLHRQTVDRVETLRECKTHRPDRCRSDQKARSCLERIPSWCDGTDWPRWLQSW